jgi:hypothetical protein
MRTALPVAYFFSVVMAPPLRLAAFRAAFPRTTVSRCEAPPPRTLLPILVTELQSSDMVNVRLWGGGCVAMYRKVVGGRDVDGKCQRFSSGIVEIELDMYGISGVKCGDGQVDGHEGFVNNDVGSDNGLSRQAVILSGGSGWKGGMGSTCANGTQKVAESIGGEGGLAKYDCSRPAC